MPDTDNTPPPTNDSSTPAAPPPPPPAEAPNPDVIAPTYDLLTNSEK